MGFSKDSKNTISDFADGVEAGTFSDFYDSSLSKPFKRQFTKEKFDVTFKEFIDNKSHVVPLLQEVPEKDAIMAFSKVEKISSYKQLWVAGSFPTSQRVTSFDFKYILEDGVWKIFAIELKFE